MKKKLMLILFCFPFFSNNTLCSSLNKKENKFLLQQEKKDDGVLDKDELRKKSIDKENKIKSLVNKICYNTLEATLTGTASMLNLCLALYDTFHQQPSYCTNLLLLQAIGCANDMFPDSVKLNGCGVTNHPLILVRFGISTLAAIKACYSVYEIKQARNKLLALTKNDKIN